MTREVDTCLDIASRHASEAARQVSAAAAAANRGVRRDGGVERPLGKKGARTRARLLAAAYEVFTRKGYRATSVSDIAEAAGVSLGTAYQYFRDRREIMSALVSDRVFVLLPDATHAWDPGRGRMGLRRVIASFVRNYVETAQFQATWEEVTHIDTEIAALRRGLGRVFTDSIEGALSDARTSGLVRSTIDPARVATALSAMVDRYCYVTYVFDPPHGDPPSVDDTVDLLTQLWADAIGLAEPVAPASVQGQRDEPRRAGTSDQRRT